MAWSSYAHLPNSEEEYWGILSKLENGISVKEVDDIIAVQKNKDKVQHHYRSNLVRMGFFSIINYRIELNYDLGKLKNNTSYLRTIFRNVIRENRQKEVEIIWDTINHLQTYELRLIIDELAKIYPLIEYNNFIRWLRPLISLMKYADILSIRRSKKRLPDAFYIQEAYFKIANSYAEAVPLEILNDELKKIDSSIGLITVLDNVLKNYRIKFKIELLMMPNWATKNKSYKINQDVYTHIKIKDSLLREE